MIERAGRGNERTAVRRIACHGLASKRVHPVKQECLVVVYLYVRSEASSFRRKARTHIEDPCLLSVNFDKRFRARNHHWASPWTKERDIDEEIRRLGVSDINTGIIRGVTIQD